MKAIVIYESMLGNTEQVARAIATELLSVMAVQVCDVADAPDLTREHVDLLVVGGPTHAFSLSRSSTRAEAVAKGARQQSQARGLRDWLEELPSGAHSQTIATFDTRANKVKRMPGSAARSAAKMARRRGYRNLIGRESFFVMDIAGPLLPGELDRARQWGRLLARAVADRAHPTGRPAVEPGSEVRTARLTTGM